MWSDTDGGQDCVALMFWPPTSRSLCMCTWYSFIMQWAVLSTHCSLSSMPPQWGSLPLRRATCQGWEPHGHGTPSIISKFSSPWAPCAADPREKESNRISKGATMVTSESFRGCQQGRALFHWGINEAPSQLWKVRSDLGARLGWEPGINVYFF